MENNLSLLVDFYELTMAASYFENHPQARAVFDLFVRKMPKERSYFVAAGLEDIVNFVLNLRFDSGSIDYLRSRRIFPPRFLEFLKDLKFTGNLWALPEGTVFFTAEPVIRVEASIIEAQLLESFLLNTINLQTTIATKASRVVLAAREAGVYDFSLRRTQGADAAVKAARSSYIAGVKGTSNVLAAKQYGIPAVGTMAHSFVMSFEDELTAFRAFTTTFPDTSVLLVDTYDTLNGVKIAVAAAKELEKKGRRLLSIRLDSGDIVRLSRQARRILDQAGLQYVKIFASGNLDEYKISRLLKAGAAVDNFGVGTNMGVSSDAPYLDVIYKISEVTDHSGRFLPTMKLSRDKVTFPGRKQVYRFFDSRGRYSKDVLGLEEEKIKGEPLLIKVMENGRLAYDLPSLTDIQKRCRENLSRLPEKVKRITAASRFPVILSPGLSALTRRLSHKLKKLT
ncbi:MAG: nicotinate phosphoribosyltransferase [Candidatus Omnitrophota bacterium]